MNLATITAFIDAQIANGNAARVIAACKSGIAAFNQTTHASDGAKAQTVADAVKSVIAPFLIAEPEVEAALAIFEPFVGKCVDSLEFTFAPVAPPLDAQDGAAVDPPA